ncbi:tRNA lysidine(34) synthetase TilS [Paracoccus albus]|uniref:tRNA lysidine(34) synthetase TilS n=1 Tax=Paracoccus albus TaxID=3017784 RepID=UPI0022F01F6A|nr:tRNA lysidine(34) synthetase TilS [Paracoccus albus]WBU60330.1 tRNA lysidine(34) synthetase TilS [Paracoccus albus]
MQTDGKTIEERVLSSLDRLGGGVAGLGVALSGGGDSVALMHVVARWARERGLRAAAATVDHGLREGSAAEAEGAAAAAKALGLEHAILRWDGSGQGNLMDRARRARQRLLSDWARKNGLDAVALGHTQDDQAETLLMRLTRGAGLDGLAAMAARRRADDMLWLRPMLDCGRAELRDWLRQIGAEWTDDPTNENPRFERVRVRRLMTELGIDPATLARSAQHLAGARDALNQALLPVLEGAELRMGSVLLDRELVAGLPAEQRRRLILIAVGFVTGADYPPRRSGTDHALSEWAANRRVTLDGAVLDPGEKLLIHREPAAAMRGRLVSGVWDNRWRISGLQAGDEVQALGADAVLFDWRAKGLSHLEAQALPAIRRGENLLCPALLAQDGLAAEPIRDKVDLIENRLGIEPGE